MKKNMGDSGAKELARKKAARSGSPGGSYGTSQARMVDSVGPRGELYGEVSIPANFDNNVRRKTGKRVMYARPVGDGKTYNVGLASPQIAKMVTRNP
jgi:hypothetical protein